MKFSRVMVVGCGKVGKLVATLLQGAGFEVTGADRHPPKDASFPTKTGDVGHAESLRELLKGQEAVVSCLPYHLNINVAHAAYAEGIHYFDLTEDVATTKAIIAMAADSKGAMVPQCGLAPGFIGIVGADLAKRFQTLRSIELRVGALPQHPAGQLGYAFNWSAEGVVNEYLNDCEVIQNGEIKLVPAMQDVETIVIDGLQLEAFTTSGGLGTMCETYRGKVEELNYKTMRYPGHCRLMRFFFHELHMKKDRETAGKILVNAKPPVSEDVVYVHAAVEGLIDGVMAREEFVRAYEPEVIDGTHWRAISWTTASSVASVVEMVALEQLPLRGFIRQEDIGLASLLGTQSGRFYQAYEDFRD